MDTKTTKISSITGGRSATEETTNITGVIMEHSVSDVTFKDVIGRSMPDWLNKHGKVTVTVRENGDHNLVVLELELTDIRLLTEDGWNNSFSYRAIVRGGPRDRIGQTVDGKIIMQSAGGTSFGNLHAA